MADCAMEASASAESPKEDMEDGELPEEGEICDDEPTPTASTAAEPQGITHSWGDALWHSLHLSHANSSSTAILSGHSHDSYCLKTQPMSKSAHFYAKASVYSGQSGVSGTEHSAAVTHYPFLGDCDTLMHLTAREGTSEAQLRVHIAGSVIISVSSTSSKGEERSGGKSTNDDRPSEPSSSRERKGRERPERPDRSSRSSAKYRDFDPKPTPADPTETMLNAWMTGVKQKNKLAPSPSFDPNEEYYGYATNAASDIIKNEDNVGGEAAANGDKDYRTKELPTGDKDYRWSDAPMEGYPPEPGSPSQIGPASNEFGDSDYRTVASPRYDPPAHILPAEPSAAAGASAAANASGPSSRRRRRRSGSNEEDGRHSRGRSKRGRHAESPPGSRKSRSSRWGDRPSICKFFREGFCRDGDQCTYSHDAADSVRKPELCKYYQQGYCKKALQCPLLHGEYPCKAFHKGECSKEQCPYSHVPLNEFTKPIFGQMMKDEELAARIHIPTGPTKRKVLLPGGPPPMPPPPTQQSSGFGPPHPGVGPPGLLDPNAPNMMPPAHPGLLPPPSLALPTLGGPPVLPYPGGVPMQDQMIGHRQPPAAAPQLYPNLFSAQSPIHSGATPPRDKENDRFIKEDESSAPSFNINQMLAEITKKVKADENEIEESPASPPMFSSDPSDGGPAMIPQIGRPQWRLLLVEIAHPPNTNLDPAIIQNSLTDPKLRNDPRIKRLLDSQFNAVSHMISASPAELPHPQQQMMTGEEVKKPSDPRMASRDPRKKAIAQQHATNTANDAPTTSAGLLPVPAGVTPLPPQLPPDDQMQQMIQMQLQMMNQQHPPAVAPQQPQAPPPYLPPALHQHPSVIQPQQPPISAPSGNASVAGGGGGGWMPQLTSSTPAYVPVGAIQPPGIVNPVLASQMGDDDDDLLLAGVGGKDPRTMTRPPLYRGKPSPPSALLTGNESPLYGDDLTNSPPGMGGRTTSLREKRKDNQYESPLSRGGAGLAASRYNQLPMGVKIRKKSSP